MTWHSWSRFVVDWSIRLMFVGIFSRRISIKSNAFLIHPRVIHSGTTTTQLQNTHWKQPHRIFSASKTKSTSLWSSTAPPESPWLSTSTTKRSIEDEEEKDSYSRPVVQWYPGHIAKAERLLRETFQAVDVVIEVRDARACHATSHPKVDEWTSNRPRIVVFTHTDLVTSSAMRNWKDYYEQFQNDNKDDQAVTLPSEKGGRVANFIWVNAKHGQGIPALHRAIFKAGAHVQERRMRRGLKDRPLRVGIMGYPNVGKSALINRLLGRRRAKSSNTPGVTRSLQWIRVRTEDGKKTHKREYELLDSPGIIPASLEDQSEALLLSACNCIGEAAYDNQVAAAYLIQWLQNLCFYGREKECAPEWRKNCNLRYGIDPLKSFPIEEAERDRFFMPFEDEDNHHEGDQATSRFLTGEEILVKVADNKCRGNPEDAARKVLQDFRVGRMGSICLQIPSQDNSNEYVDPRMGTKRGNAFGPQTESLDWQALQEKMELEKEERLRSARKRADEQGLELPPSILLSNDEKAPTTDDKEVSSNSEVGKGLFEGW